MEYLLDTANINEIKTYCDFLPIAGITSNPSILKKEGKIDFFGHMRAIREVIGKQPLHIQVTAPDAQGMLRDAEAIAQHVDKKAYIKVPTNLEGLQVIGILKKQGYNVTATAIYSTAQGLLAMEAGADCLAPYYNRMENLNINPEEVIRTFAAMIDRYGYKTQIIAASFKNMGQVNKAFLAGAQAATVDPSILKSALMMPDIQKAIDDFDSDWKSVYGDKYIADL
jgi:TalC/MipB family fructose-6-phosphate aldolase